MLSLFSMKSFVINFVLFSVLVAAALFFVHKFDLVKNKSVVFSLDNGLKDKIGILEFGSNEHFADADFFKRAKDELQAEQVDFIEADLSNMVLKVYQKGQLAFEVPIKTKGREGSWWETPSGIYKIQYKAENHFSSFGNVYQPYSLAFEGNFFIHGWPYYPDGEPVASTFSGGCIRLDDADAKKVFEVASVGMPVLVFEADSVSDDFKYAMFAPEISAQNYLVADLKNNFILAEKNSSEKIPAGSATKLVTALVAGEYVNLDKDIVVPFEAVAPNSNSILKGGNSLSAYNLLFPLLMEDSVEPAETFAAKLGKKRYINLMNEKTVSIGMKETKFVDVSGESLENVTNAQDLFLLLKYLYNNRSFLLKISSGKMDYSAYGSPVYNQFFEDNLYIGDKTFLGGQIDIFENNKSDSSTETINENGVRILSSTPVTSEGKILGSTVVIFEMSFKGQKRPIAFILYESQDVEGDIRKIKDYLEKIYS